MTDEEQGVDDTTDTEFRRQIRIDISDALTDGQTTAGEADNVLRRSASGPVSAVIVDHAHAQ